MKIILEQVGSGWIAYFMFGSEPGAFKEVGETPHHALEKLMAVWKGK